MSTADKWYYVYTHSRQDTGVVFYVGCASLQPRKRGKHQYQRAYDFGQHTEAWKKEAANGVIVQIIFETRDRQEAFTFEHDLVDLYGRRNNGTGYLVNECAGGQGAPEQPSTPSSRAKKSQAQRGKLNSMYGRTGALHGMSCPVIDTQAGVFYESVGEAAQHYGFKMKTLYNWLSGFRRNPTSLRLA